MNIGRLASLLGIIVLASSCLACSSDDDNGSSGGKGGKGGSGGSGGGSGGGSAGSGADSGTSTTGIVEATVSYSGTQTGNLVASIAVSFPPPAPPDYVKVINAPITFPTTFQFDSVAAGDWKFSAFLAVGAPHSIPFPTDPKHIPLSFTVVAGEKVHIDAEIIDIIVDAGTDAGGDGSAAEGGGGDAASEVGTD